MHPPMEVGLGSVGLRVGGAGEGEGASRSVFSVSSGEVSSDGAPSAPPRCFDSFNWPLPSRQTLHNS